MRLAVRVDVMSRGSPKPTRPIQRNAPQGHARTRGDALRLRVPPVFTAVFLGGVPVLSRNKKGTRASWWSAALTLQVSLGRTVAGNCTYVCV